LLKLENNDIVKIVGTMPQSNTIEVKYINALSEKSGKPKR
jgi:hypothetical protein